MKTTDKKIDVNTGLWIPIYILKLSELSTMEKLVLCRIYHLDNDEKGCYANNRFFADYFNISRTQISKIINSIVTKGFVESMILKERGNKRFLKVLPKVTAKVFEDLYPTYNDKIDDPIEPMFKHNKEYNKKLNKEISKNILKKRENENHTRFEILKNNSQEEVNKVCKLYKLPYNEMKYCINKYNQKVDSNSILDFENFISNWKKNLKPNNQVASTTGHLYKNKY